MDKLVEDIKAYVKNRGVVYDTEIETEFATNETLEERRRISMIVITLINKGEFICTPSEPAYLVSYSGLLRH